MVFASRLMMLREELSISAASTNHKRCYFLFTEDHPTAQKGKGAREEGAELV